MIVLYKIHSNRDLFEENGEYLINNFVLYFLINVLLELIENHYKILTDLLHHAISVPRLLFHSLEKNQYSTSVKYCIRAEIKCVLSKICIQVRQTIITHTHTLFSIIFLSLYSLLRLLTFNFQLKIFFRPYAHTKPSVIL